MALSRDVTAKILWERAERDLKMAASDALRIERYQLISQVSSLISTLFADLMIQSYMDEDTLTVNSTGRASTGAGTFVAATGLLTITMDSDWDAVDEGNLVTLLIGTNTVIPCYVNTFVSTTSVILGGAALPATDQTIVTALMTTTSPTSTDSISLTGIRMQRTGPQISCTLDSSVTDVTEALGLDDLRVWPTTTFQHKNKIVWSLSGDTLLLKKGSSLSSYGTLTFRFPRVATPVTVDASKVDLPDGAAMELALIKLKMYMLERMNIPVKQVLPDYERQTATYVSALYRAFGSEVSNADILDKVKALV